MMLNNIWRRSKSPLSDIAYVGTEDDILDSAAHSQLGGAMTTYQKVITIFTSSVAITALILLLFSVAYINNPGPSIMYDHFPALVMSTFLLFGCLQVVLLIRYRTLKTGWFKTTFRWIYWIVISTTSFISGVGWAVAKKPDAAVVQFLAFFVGITGLLLLRSWNRTLEVKQSATSSRWYFKFIRGFNRFLKIIHGTFSILFTAGAITLAMQFTYTNFGTRYNVSLTNGRTIALNVYCTGPPSNSTPTIWFESSQAHGITDFHGVQSYLLTNYNRQSCSYDHVSQGWSDPAPVDFTNSSMYWSSLLNTLGRQNEPYIGVGWGDGGEDVIGHALESPSTTSGVVFLDTSPDGIEWMDESRKQGWNNDQMLAYRDTDLAGRIELTQIILSLAIPWGLLPIFIPNNATGYFNTALYPAHRSQSLKDDLWIFQYYVLIQMRAQPRLSTYLTDSILPSSIPIYSIITNKTSAQSTSDLFGLQKKIDLVAHLAGGEDKVKGWEWCDDQDCDLGFPVDKSLWTAQKLIELGI